jgi:hypothetical protein
LTYSVTHVDFSAFEAAPLRPKRTDWVATTAVPVYKRHGSVALAGFTLAQTAWSKWVLLGL